MLISQRSNLLSHSAKPINPAFVDQLESKKIWASSGRKVSHTSRSSHLPDPESTKSDTLVSKVCPFGVIGLLVLPLGNHGSAHMLTELPSPILQIIPSFNSSSPRMMLRHE
jgi:hypothetical protein